MEFIPLEKYSKGGKRKARNEDEVTETVKSKASKKNETFSVKKSKGRPQTKVIEKKKVKNKYRENLEEKRKKRKIKKNEIVEEEEEEEQEEAEDEEEEAEETEEEEEEDVEDQQEAFKNKCKEMDEKKKKRLFLKLKKKIHSEGQIKELHPDIKSVIFPRKKNSRWCWAVFASQERAEEAFLKLVKNKDVIVSKPNPYEKVELKWQKKMKAVEKKKEARKKLQKMWM